jgi:hypothetical protein
MKLTPEELGELQFYVDELTPELKMQLRKDNEEVLEFAEYDLVLYKAKVRVLREDPKTKQQTSEKEIVYFLETSRAAVRQTTSFKDVCLAAIIYIVAEDIRLGFDLVRQDFKASHPQQEGERRLQ